MRISHKNVYSRRTKGYQPSSSQRAQAVNSIEEITNPLFGPKSTPSASEASFPIPSNFSFPKSSRILKRKHFKEIGSSRNRYFGKLLVIDYRSSTEAKLGITVVRQFGNAVERNLFKRRVRESFRSHRSHLQAYEMIIMPKKGVETFSLELITQDLLEFSNVSQSRAAKSR